MFALAFGFGYAVALLRDYSKKKDELRREKVKNVTGKLTGMMPWKQQVFASDGYVIWEASPQGFVRTEELNIKKPKNHGRK